jgi:hypothetical protein
MQLQFRSRDRQAQHLRGWALLRAKFVLRRMAWRVSHASVQLSDVDGPRHGVDKRCLVSILATDGAPVVVSATARDWPTALNQALTRALAVLKRLFLRAQQARRTQRLFIRNDRAGGALNQTA